MNENKNVPALIWIVLGILSISVVILGVLFFVLWNSKPQFNALGELNVTPLQAVNPSPPALAVSELEVATASLTRRVETLEASVASLAQLPVKTITLPTTASPAKVTESYIPLGTGNTRETDWTDIPGIEAYVVPSNYGSIQSLFFEVSLELPTGQGVASARLRNVTDNIGLYESEISYEGSTGKLLSSGALPVPHKSTLYRVQLKSSLAAPVIAGQARLKIFSK